MNPLLTVVITTYNQESFVGATVESALAQTYPNREVLVVDDGSTDGTAARLSAFGDRIVYIRQENRGVAESRNTGVSRARGDLLAFLDGDDIWEPDKLAVQVDAYRKFPEAGMVVVDACTFNGSEETDPSTLPWKRGFLEASPDGVCCAPSYTALLPYNFIMTTSQVMVPATVLAAVGASDPRFRIASDYDLYLRIAKRYDIAFVNRVLTHWRYVPTSASGPAALRPFRCGLEDIRVLTKQLDGAPAEVRRFILETLRRKSWVTARDAYYYGWDVDRHFARRFLPELWQLNPRSVWPLLYWTALLCPAAFQAPIKSLCSTLLPTHRRGFPGTN